MMMEVKLKVQKEEICQQLFRNYQRQSMICVGEEYRKKATSRVSVVLGLGGGWDWTGSLVLR